MTDIPKLTHCGISAERFTDKNGPAILLTQMDAMEEPSVLLHPMQLRAICDHFGLAPTSDPLALQAIKTLERRLLTLKGRIDHMARALSGSATGGDSASFHGPTYAAATTDIAAEFCADLEGCGHEPANA